MASDRTLAIIKPDAFGRGLAGQVIAHLEQAGFRLIASGLTYCLEHPEEAAESGYPLDEVQRLFTKLA